ncbi:MAG: helix-turn-helix domain-containing protein [Actinomycetia bacterium]|nr:helix-turn-helix domain-containing protein [Actinomycetes bacterium]
MDARTLGERIAAARRDLDLTQHHLASRAGLERTALGRIEAGERKVSAVELVDLANALDAPLAWFVRDPLPAVVSRRTDASPQHEVTAKLDRELELFSGDIADLLARGVIGTLPERPKWRVPQHHTESEQTAMEVRARLGAGSGPLHDIAAAAESFGLFSASLALGDGGADGALVEVVSGAGAAVIDGDPRSGRRRMSLAHELGHWLFGDAYDAGASDTERMIKSFAVHLLAPRAGVVKVWAQDSKENLRDCAIRVAGSFRLSWSAAIPHLLHLDLITEQQRRELLQVTPVPGEFVKLRLALNTEELSAPSLSPGLTSSILSAYVDRRITGPRAVELLRGQLAEADLPPRRAETAIDFASP